MVKEKLQERIMLLQKELEKQIKESEDNIASLQKSLKKYDLDLDDVLDEQEDIEAEIKARKVENKIYFFKGCKFIICQLLKDSSLRSE